jgi:hypothetical protein
MLIMLFADGHIISTVLGISLGTVIIGLFIFWIAIFKSSSPSSSQSTSTEYDIDNDDNTTAAPKNTLSDFENYLRKFFNRDYYAWTEELKKFIQYSPPARIGYNRPLYKDKYINKHRNSIDDDHLIDAYLAYKYFFDGLPNSDSASRGSSGYDYDSPDSESDNGSLSNDSSSGF